MNGGIYKRGDFHKTVNGGREEERMAVPPKGDPLFAGGVREIYFTIGRAQRRQFAFGHKGKREDYSRRIVVS